MNSFMVVCFTDNMTICFATMYALKYQFKLLHDFVYIFQNVSLMIDDLHQMKHILLRTFEEAYSSNKTLTDIKRILFLSFNVCSGSVFKKHEKSSQYQPLEIYHESPKINEPGSGRGISNMAVLRHHWYHPCESSPGWQRLFTAFPQKLGGGLKHLRVRKMVCLDKQWDYTLSNTHHIYIRTYACILYIEGTSETGNV